MRLTHSNLITIASVLRNAQAALTGCKPQSEATLDRAPNGKAAQLTGAKTYTWPLCDLQANEIDALKILCGVPLALGSAPRVEDAQAAFQLAEARTEIANLKKALETMRTASTSGIYSADDLRKMLKDSQDMLANCQRELIESQGEVQSLNRTIEKLRARISSLPVESYLSAIIPPVAPVKAQPTEVILRFDQGQQTKALKAAGVSLDQVRALFIWTFNDRDEPSQGGYWKSRPTLVAKAQELADVIFPDDGNDRADRFHSRIDRE